MTFLGRLTGAGAVLVLLATASPAPATAGEVHEDLANRARALSEFFARLSTPEGAHALVESAAFSDPEAFNRLLDGIDIPVPNKCLWVRDVIEKFVSTPVGFVTECRLRQDLTPDEWLLYLTISLRHRRALPVEHTASMHLVLSDSRGPVIPPGPFLDELMANGLVKCESSEKYDSATALAYGPARRFCFGQP